MCQCRSKQVDETSFLNALDSVRLKGVAQQSERATSAMSEFYKATDRLDRAIALDANSGTVDTYRAVVQSTARLLERQFSAIVEGIDTTIGASDWPEVVERVESEFYRRNGPEAIADARTRLVQSLIDTDGVSGSVAKAAITRYDDAWQSFQENGLSGPISMWRDSANRASSVLLGSSASSFAPRADVKAVDVCIGVVFAELLIASIACFFIPYCWCCYIMTLSLLAPLKAATCLLVFDDR